MREEKNMLNSR